MPESKSCNTSSRWNSNIHYCPWAITPRLTHMQPPAWPAWDYSVMTCWWNALGHPFRPVLWSAVHVSAQLVCMAYFIVPSSNPVPLGATTLPCTIPIFSSPITNLKSVKTLNLGRLIDDIKISHGGNMTSFVHNKTQLQQKYWCEIYLFCTELHTFYKKSRKWWTFAMYALTDCVFTCFPSCCSKPNNVRIARSGILA